MSELSSHSITEPWPQQSSVPESATSEFCFVIMIAVSDTQCTFWLFTITFIGNTPALSVGNMSLAFSGSSRAVEASSSTPSPLCCQKHWMVTVARYAHLLTSCHGSHQCVIHLCCQELQSSKWLGWVRECVHFSDCDPDKRVKTAESLSWVSLTQHQLHKPSQAGH